MDKSNSNEESIFIDLKKYKNNTNKPAIFQSVYKNLFSDQLDKHIYKINQAKLKIIDGYPFIYWISEGFREKFKASLLGEVNKVATGLMTGDNDKHLRFIWEVDQEKISNFYPEDKKRWVPYQKGGDYNKWFGNNWLTVNFLNDGAQLATTDNKDFYFKEGITYSAASSKGVSFRYVTPKYVFDKGGASIFNLANSTNVFYLLGFLNTKLTFYITDCLNPTANIQKGDIERIPFVEPSNELENNVKCLAEKNVEIKQLINSYKIVEFNFKKNPIIAFHDSSLKEKIFSFLDFENLHLTLVLINEALINKQINALYELSIGDLKQIESKMGRPIGDLPVVSEARQAYLTELVIENAQVKDFIESLDSINLQEQQLQEIKADISNLYRSSYDVEEFCIRHEVNPINVWYWFKRSNVVPQGRAQEIALEFLADVTRTVLMEDEDGIIPLVGLPGEPALLDRLEQKCLSLGLSFAQFAQLDQLLNRPVKEYLEYHFFSDLSDYVKLYKRLPSTPFIWHLSSGKQQGFEAYIIIYKWTRDSLYKLKTTYIARREEALNYRLSNIADSSTAQAQTEKETIRLQLQEIADFTRQVDELIAEGYDPKLDDGVGKNIAPLQKKGMLRADVLNAKQLEKYLNADW